MRSCSPAISRGMADEVSDIEMLVVTREPLDLEDCFRFARAAGLDGLGTWGVQGGPTRRVSGYRERVTALSADSTICAAPGRGTRVRCARTR